MAVKQIVIKGASLRKELIAASAITPGMLVERTSSNTVQAHSTAGQQTPRAFCMNSEMTGDGIDDAYAANDTVQIEYVSEGAEVYAFLKNGENVSIVDRLVSDGAGALQAIATPSTVPQATGAVQDDDDAATNGTAVYAHLDALSGVAGTIAHLESVNAGNADSDFDIGSGGPTVRVHDDDAAATGGLQVYFDEDASNADERFLINNTVTGQDCFVLASDGKMIRLKHDASASSNGVALYFDDNASNEEERLLFVSPTNADGSFTTDDQVSMVANAGPESAVAIALEAVNNSGGGSGPNSSARIIVEVI